MYISEARPPHEWARFVSNLFDPSKKKKFDPKRVMLVRQGKYIYLFKRWNKRLYVTRMGTTVSVKGTMMQAENGTVTIGGNYVLHTRDGINFYFRHKDNHMPTEALIDDCERRLGRLVNHKGEQKGYVRAQDRRAVDNPWHKQVYFLTYNNQEQYLVTHLPRYNNRPVSYKLNNEEIEHGYIERLAWRYGVSGTGEVAGR